MLRIALAASLALLTIFAGSAFFQLGHLGTPAQAQQPRDLQADWRDDALQILEDARKLPVKDAAFLLWRQKYTIDRGLSPMTDEEIKARRAKTSEQTSQELRYEREHAQDGNTFDRLKQVHPKVSDDVLKEAIVDAVRFERACFDNFRHTTLAEFETNAIRAVAKARHEHPGYLKKTYREAENWVMYHMK